MVLILEPTPGAEPEADVLLCSARRFGPVRSLIEYPLEGVLS